MTMNGAEILAWIDAQHEAGHTVYARTALRTIVLKKKHRAMIRERDGHCEVQRGKRWDSINYCHLSAEPS